MQAAALKRRCSQAALCRFLAVLAAALALFALLQWEEHIPGIAYLRKRAKKVAPPHPDAPAPHQPDPLGDTRPPPSPPPPDPDPVDASRLPPTQEQPPGHHRHPDPDLEPDRLDGDDGDDGDDDDDAVANQPPNPPPAAAAADDDVDDPLLAADLDAADQERPRAPEKPAAPRAAPRLKDEPCRKYIVYDKPVKTGSSAISLAIREYLETVGQTTDLCSRDECTEMAQDICAGKRKPRVLVGHMYGEDGLLECLRDRGYYVATSVREPRDRWESAYLFNKKKNGTHYGIPYQKGYRYFMQHFPPCALYEYYDGDSAKCRQHPTEDRIKPIVARYDEIIDLYDDTEPRGQLARIISKYIHEKNKSPRPDDGFREPFDTARLKNETMLYEALKRRREEILEEGQAPLCE